MKITVISVGKLKEKYLKAGIDEYAKRLSAYCKLQFVEVADEKCPENLSPAQMEQVKDAEAQRIVSKIPNDSLICTLEIEGKQVNSEAFASRIEQAGIQGQSSICFIIGGSLGLADSIKAKSKWTLSFSKMTLPHQLMKLVLTEQIYRAFRIIRNEPYHK